MIDYAKDELTKEQLFEIMDGMEKVNRVMAQKIEEKAPICHFRKMNLERSDSVDGYYMEWWECSVCGHTEDFEEQIKDIRKQRNKTKRMLKKAIEHHKSIYNRENQI